MKTYELMVILLSSLKDEVVTKTLEQISEEVVKQGGKVTATELLGSRAFARPMKKQQAGQYVRLTLDLPPASATTLKARLKLNESLFRFELTVSPGPMVPRRPRREDAEKAEVAGGVAQ